jgi:hypothetical protein
MCGGAGVAVGVDVGERITLEAEVGVGLCMSP